MRPRKNPCPSCPYRRDVPSGVWAAAEYERLPGYDGPTHAQTEIGVFLCHQGNDELCSGWAALSDEDTLALRIARSIDPDVDIQACIDHATDVPLFASGAEAAAHGMREIETPGPDARDAVSKIARVRALRGRPVGYGEEESR
jgi:hypothetical protein